MATCDFTTPVRRYRSAFASLVLADIETDTNAASLFVKTGETFDPAPVDLVLRQARRLVTAHFRLGAPVLDNRERLREFVTFEIGTRDHEVFALILLDSANRFIAYEELFHGTVDGVTVHPRIVLECVIEHKAT